MILKDYPSGNTQNLKDVQIQLQQICNIRKSDALAFANLTSIFIMGRKVGKVPSASNDVVPATDKVGDFNVTATYAYFLINNAGTAEWRRVAVGSW